VKEEGPEAEVELIEGDRYPKKKKINKEEEEGRAGRDE